jgi:soluble cytochrome b562
MGTKQYDGVAIEYTAEEQAQRDASAVLAAQEKAAEEAAEAARLLKRPKRSSINALQSKIGTDNSVADLRETMALLVTMMDDVLAFQSVNVDEDVP